MKTSITEAVRDGNTYDIEELLQAGLDQAGKPFALLQAMMDGLEQCGHKFEEGEFFRPELLMASDAFNTGMRLLEPHLGQATLGLSGKVIMGTVAGDVHDIGKNLVGFLLKSSGFEVIDLGTDVETAAFVEAIKEHQPDVLGLSALLTTTMLGMGDVIEAMDAEGLRKRRR